MYEEHGGGRRFCGPGHPGDELGSRSHRYSRGGLRLPAEKGSFFVYPNKATPLFVLLTFLEEQNEG